MLMDGYPPVINECIEYGLAFGECNIDCPVLNNGECEIWSSVEDYIEENGGK